MNTHASHTPRTPYPLRRINTDLNAANVIELDIDYSIVQQSYDEVSEIFLAGEFEGLRVSGTTGIGLYAVSPGWNGDIRWVSSGNEKAFDFFDRYFRELGVAEKTQQILGDNGELIMYSGFFVTRTHATDSNYHQDYSDGVGMNAFTLMTPIMATGEKGNLLYKTVDGEEQVYRYQTGTAVCFGSDFLHSTEPFQSDTPYAFLCFTYGVRNKELWPRIAETVAEQGLLYRHPQDGVVENDE